MQGEGRGCPRVLLIRRQSAVDRLGSVGRIVGGEAASDLESSPSDHDSDQNEGRCAESRRECLAEAVQPRSCWEENLGEVLGAERE